MFKSILIGLGLGLGGYLIYRSFNLDEISAVNGEGDGFIESVAGDFFGVSATFNTGLGMQLSFKGYAHIKFWEGFRATRYLDSAGKATIGYGHLITAFEDYDTITADEADTLLIQDVSAAEAAVNKLVTRQINQNQFDALVSFVFNVGRGAFARSTLLKKVNAGDMAGAKAQFGLWVKAGGKTIAGLVNRRTGDANLFASTGLA